MNDLNTDDLDLPRGTDIFINQSLCPYYCILWSKSKRLHSMGIFIIFYISRGTLKFRMTENSRPLAITHLKMILQCISPMLICHHHQNRHILVFFIHCVHFFFFGYKFCSIFGFAFSWQNLFFFVIVGLFFAKVSSNIKILKSKQTFYFNIMHFSVIRSFINIASIFVNKVLLNCYLTN